MKKLFLSTIAAMSMLTFTACASGGGDNAGEDSNTDVESTQAESTAMAEEPEETMAQEQDIVGLASSQDNLSTLVAAVKAAGLVETLQGDGPFTVFAPTNAAFEALPAGTLENLLKPENKDQLVSILTYHVVSGEVMSTDLSDGMKAATVEGSEVEVGIDGESVMINDASVVAANVEASNGVVHVIDKVILPPNM